MNLDHEETRSVGLEFHEGKNMRYQLGNSIDNKRYERIIWKDSSHALNLHRFLEIAYVLEGEIIITINGKSEHMYPGDMAFMFPHAIHSYRALTPNKVAIYIVAGDYFPFVAGRLEGCEADTYILRPGKCLRDYFEEAFLGPDDPSPLLIKSVLYGLFHSYLQNCNLTKKTDSDSVLVSRICTYVSTNYNKQITVKDMAKELGYNANYISSIINRSFGMTFSYFLNLYRMDYAYNFLRETNKSITSIAMECGFSSIRSFNRNFLRITGETPNKYRKRFEAELVTKLDM